jgi:hypothetical protein
VIGLPPPDRDAARRGHAAGGWLGMLQAVVDELRARGEPCGWFIYHRMYAELGETDQLLECLGARVSGGGLFQWVLPVYDPYRDEPRFQALLEPMNVVGIPLTGPV